jgi:Thioredoxin like C-terminal domain
VAQFKATHAGGPPWKSRVDRFLDLFLYQFGGAHFLISGSVQFRVLIDGTAPGAAHGIDLNDQGNGSVTEPRMYQLVRQPQPIVDRSFEIEFLDSGVEAFSFTFG